MQRNQTDERTKLQAAITRFNRLALSLPLAQASGNELRECLSGEMNENSECEDRRKFVIDTSLSLLNFDNYS